MKLRRTPTLLLLGLLTALVALVATGCGREAEGDTGGVAASTTGEQFEGRIEVDGSSTVGPLVSAAAESFRAEQPGVDVTVGISGTGGGFERFCAGETDISNASRPIKEDEEAPLCEDKGIEYTELQVANDALTVVVNPDNDWAGCLTVDQLKTMWEPGAEGEVTSWNQVDPSFPDEELLLFGAGTDSGTFDYFTDAVNGEEGASRTDYRRPRTTTSPSKASRTRTAASATSGSRTSSRTRTGSRLSRSTAATAASHRAWRLLKAATTPRSPARSSST